ncbi:HpcH/HpaI aldolase family protein [Pseudaquabacterium rugosum]|jgi:2-keto-3-deoxy-L-rhamnonate aldolase RhmA|uniref:Aldolase/citrate lyase family protein n=1 Tax=Pseudaquabacterium rugosum TaxID=2984194 RepID=A0ABU9BGB5_9BURK
MSGASLNRAPRMIENAALQRMRADAPALGMQVRLGRSGEVAALAAATGHDWLMLDLQHSGIDIATVVEISLCAYGFGVTPVVRVGGPDHPDTVRLLDAGVMGMILPDTRTEAQAQAFVRTCRFPPLGTRSVTTGYVTLGYEPLHIATAAEVLNRETLVVCMIESVQGVEALERIAAVEGVDVIHLGCNDLLMEMGQPGDFASPDLAAIVERLLAACQRHGKFAGMGGDRDVARQRRFLQAGGRFLTTDSDLGFLRAAARGKTDALRAAPTEAGP